MNSRKRKKFNTKKGISLVLAITLSAVLILTTTSFISLALLQQNETGSELNTRQAYVSAKSALDIAKEMIQSGQINLQPLANGEHFYVLYYDKSSKDIKASYYSSATDALNAIKNMNQPSSPYTVIGNSYIKVNKNGTNSTLSAFSSENKYTGGGDNNGSQGDLSMKFDAIEGNKPETIPVNLRVDIGDYGTKSDPTGNRFMLVGRQTNFSLLKSAYAKFWNQNANMSTIDSYFKYTGNNGGSKEPEVQFKSFLETATYPLQTQFPLVFTEAVKIDSNTDRCTYKVYDDGVYFLGNYSGKNLDEVGHTDAKKVGYYLNNNTYGADIHCKFIVIENNMAARLSGQKALNLTYLGNGPSDYVIVYMPNGSTFYTLNSKNIVRPEKSYPAGYYKLKSGDDLFTGTLQRVSDPDNDPYCRAVIAKSLYKSLFDENHNLKEIHAAYESEVDNGKEKVSILSNDGSFSSDTKGHNYSTGPRPDYYTGWDNYSIYCGPSRAPSNGGHYELYCGESFNYLWYNVDPMNVRGDVVMSIRSRESVLTIGGDANYGEKAVIAVTNSNQKIQTYTPNMPLPDGTKKLNEPNHVEYAASNKLIGENGAEFWLRPYWGESSYAIRVMNDFDVIYSGGSYTVKRGNYTNDLPSAGINLFSSAGKEYFTTHTTEIHESNVTEIGWVDNTGKIISTSNPANQVGKTVNFKASSGQLANATYEATVINCDFSAFSSPVKTNGSTKLVAKSISLKGDIQGANFIINTSGGVDNKCTVVNADGSKSVITGIALVVEEDLDLFDESGKKIIKKLDKGYYFFPTNSGQVNLLDENLWTTPYYYADKKNEDISGINIKWVPVVDINFSEGRYY